MIHIRVIRSEKDEQNFRQLRLGIKLLGIIYYSKRVRSEFTRKNTNYDNNFKLQVVI